MRLSRRTQGRIPIRLATTKWMFAIWTDRKMASFELDNLRGLHQLLLPMTKNGTLKPESLVRIWRNDRLIYEGTWHDLADDPTLW